eukprot:8837210-Ditylum_brightwellii.AAC.1
MKIQYTGTQQTNGSLSEDIQLLMKSDEANSVSDSDLSNDGKKKVKANKVIRAGRSTSKNEGEVTFAYNTIFDLGTEWAVLDSPVWSIQQCYKSLKMTAIDNIMKNVAMKCCEDITTIQNRAGQTRLFGIRRSIHSSNLMDNETVANHHTIYKVGLVVWPSSMEAHNAFGSKLRTIYTWSMIQTNTSYASIAKVQSSKSSTLLQFIG